MNARTLLLLIFALVACDPTADAGIVVDIGDAQADLAPGFGTTTASFDVIIRNDMVNTIELNGYTLLLDIEPVSNDLPELPAGVSFGSPEATYQLSAFQDNTETNPAAGDLGVNQFVISSTSLDPAASVTALTVNLEIDRATAIAGDYGLALNLTGENTIDFTDGSLMSVTPTFTGGTLTLNAIPEPSAMLYGALVALAGVGMWFRKKRLNLS